MVVMVVASAAPPARASVALRPLVATRGSYGESFTFIADLDDGTYLQLAFGLTNLGPGSVKGVCRAMVVPPEGNPWRASTRVGRDGWSWNESAEERLSIGPCSVSAGPAGTGVEVPLEGGSVRLVFADRATRRSPADSSVAIGGDWYRTEILLYRTAVTGTLALPGAVPRAVTGAGYADHTRSTIKPRDLAERWVRFRSLRGDRGLLLLGRRGHDGSFTPVWSCDPPDHCRHYPSFAVDRSGDRNAPVFQVALGAEGDPLEIRSQRLLYRDAPVEQLGVLGRLVAPFVGAPVTYVYRARLAGNGGAPMDGILEVELSGE
jgi:hypothetical protein